MRPTESTAAFDQTRLLFIGGFPSGGTELVKLILNAHPEVEIQNEAPLLYKLRDTIYRPSTVIRTRDELTKFRRTISRLDVWNTLSISLRTLPEWYDLLPISVQQLLFFPRDGVRIVGNKTPQNTEHILHLNSLFPHAIFLIVVRDVRDVALSWKKKWGKDPYHCSAKWANRMRGLWSDKQVIPEGRLKVIKFEELLEDPETMCRGICTFLGLEWSENMMSHHKFVKEELEGKLNYDKPLMRGNKEKWRIAFSPSEIESIEEIAYDEMRLLGYRPEVARRRRPLGPLGRLIGYSRDSVAILAVGNRGAKDNSLKRRLWSLGFQVRRRLLVVRS